MPLKDPTSDMAVIARSGSKLVKDVREKKESTKSRARFWEMAGSKMGKITAGMPGLPGATPIVPGVAMGGFDSARELVEAGGAQANQFRFYTRYCGWGPGQLDNEVLQNVWTPAAASKELILRAPPAGGPHAMWRQVHSLMGSEPDDWWAARDKASGM